MQTRWLALSIVSRSHVGPSFYLYTTERQKAHLTLHQNLCIGCFNAVKILYAQKSLLKCNQILNLPFVVSNNVFKYRILILLLFQYLPMVKYVVDNKIRFMLLSQNTSEIRRYPNVSPQKFPNFPSRLRIAIRLLTNPAYHNRLYTVALLFTFA